MKKAKIFFLFIILLTSCKQYRIDQAQIAEEDLNYDKAIEHYEKLAAKHDDYSIHKSLAILYLKRGDYESAKTVYDSLISHNNYPKEDLLAYTEILIANGDYSAAKLWLERYLREASDDKKALALKKIILNQGTFLIDTNQYSLELIDIQTTPQAYAATPFMEGIIYTGKAEKSEKRVKINPWDGWPYSRIYYVVPVDSGWSAPYDLSVDLNEQYHIGPVVMIPNSNPPTLLLSKSNISDQKVARKNPLEKGIIQRTDNKVQLYKVEINDMRLDTPQVLSFCKPENNYAQASLTPNGRMMVFSSDMPGGKGGSDLYITFREGKIWSDPINLGSNINTEKNESFPNLISEDTLYFSSESHGSYGGLDVFYSTFDGDKWTKPVNLLYPLNSYQDDFAISYNTDKKSGFVSSNREGEDNIYSFTKNTSTFRIEGLVIDKESQEKMPFIKIVLINRRTLKDTIIYSDDEGKFNFSLASNSKYRVIAEENNYFIQSYNVSTRGRTQSKVFHVVFEMEKIEINKPIVIDDSKGEIANPLHSRLKNIYYDFDKWDIRNDAIFELDQLVWLLKDNPTLLIEISAHTDSRGSDQYNLNLSQKRADAVVAYLIDRGIDPSILVSKGYGETMLINECKNNVECSEDDHQKNRRSEFKVIGFKE